MSKTTIRFSVESIRTLSTHPDDAVRSINMIVAEVKEISHQFDLWRMPELRSLDVSDSASQVIRKTLAKEPREFFYRNRGITLSASCVGYDNRNSTVAIELADPMMHGLIDGGHTYQIICNYMDELTEEAKMHCAAYVRLEVLSGVTDYGYLQDLLFERNFGTMRLEN